MPNHPRLQTFHRSARRLLRHPLMQEVAAGDPMLTNAVRHFVRRFTEERFGPPWFALDELHRMVRRALRMVETGRRPWALYERLCVYIRRTLVLMRGLLCGRHRPMLEETFCPICLSDEDGDWWFSMECGPHHFHVDCLFAHLEFDTRCPLCRGEI